MTNTRYPTHLRLGDVGGVLGSYVLAFNDGRVCVRHEAAHKYVTFNCVPIAWPSDCAPIHLRCIPLESDPLVTARTSTRVERWALMRRVGIALADGDSFFVPPRVLRRFRVEVSAEPDSLAR